MYYNENTYKCKYLIEHPDTDEVAFCPRLLTSLDKYYLLDSLKQEIFGFAELLEFYLNRHSESEFEHYFEKNYLKLSRTIRQCEKDLTSQFID